MEFVDLTTRDATNRQCVRGVYEAFRPYPLAPHIDPDPCFPSFCDDRPLRAAPLHRLPPSAFDRYQWKAITTWGNVDDFKHFLPRLLEIIATPTPQDAHSDVEAQLIFGKLRYGEWRSWNPAEQWALDAYFDAFWSVLLVRPVDVTDAAWAKKTLGDWLSDFARAHDDVGRFLKQWEVEAGHPTEGLLPAAHLAQTVTRAGGLLKKGSLDWGIGSELNAQEDQTTAWLASDAVLHLLEAAFFRWPDTPYTMLISEGHNCLEWWRQSRAQKA